MQLELLQLRMFTFLIVQVVFSSMCDAVALSLFSSVHRQHNDAQSMSMPSVDDVQPLPISIFSTPRSGMGMYALFII